MVYCNSISVSSHLEYQKDSLKRPRPGTAVSYPVFPQFSTRKYSELVWFPFLQSLCTLPSTLTSIIATLRSEVSLTTSTHPCCLHHADEWDSVSPEPIYPPDAIKHQSPNPAFWFAAVGSESTIGTWRSGHPNYQVPDFMTHHTELRVLWKGKERVKFTLPIPNRL